MFSPNEKYAKYNNCDHLISQMKALSVLESALLWCGVPMEEIPALARECTPLGDTGKRAGIFKHPYISCVERRCILLQEAFESNLLKMGRDGGEGEYHEKILHIAYPRRTIIINDLREYILKHHPNDMPETLFSKNEIHKVQPISNEDYTKVVNQNATLERENEYLKGRLEKAIEIYHKQEEKIKSLEKNQIQDDELSERSEQGFLVTVGGLIDIILKNTPNYNQEKIIGEIASLEFSGQSADTLKKRFAKANAEYHKMQNIIKEKNKFK